MEIKLPRGNINQSLIKHQRANHVPVTLHHWQSGVVLGCWSEVPPTELCITREQYWVFFLLQGTWSPSNPALCFQAGKPNRGLVWHLEAFQVKM